jgi:exopolyphosphatase/guanosine-5'-triphosphate,3'-diphosphate pyrophosphatase
MIALLCRFHRKAMPAARHSMFNSMTAEARRTLLMLIPILRIADNLDRGHAQRVESIECQMRSGAIVVGVHSSEDVDLEIWAAERTADIFRQVYNVPLVIARAKYRVPA